ncbi:Coq4 family protein [Vacuolonema iberomarrocanum]|uniref:Coq4 family protein n=1 Tax=Vacuolonema iberomarrocanum TaxID=3454632 RepID=UPI0019E230ED|nr:ubiquinone biosynthesis protein [filamentous cyanobacterium LEGE 07170]
MNWTDHFLPRAYRKATHPGAASHSLSDSVLATVRELQEMPAFQGFLVLMADNYSLESVEEMAKILLETPSFERAVTHLQQDPAAAAMIAERYMAPPHDLDTLLDCPPDSLGYLYAKEMKAKGLQAEDLYVQIPIVSEASYVEARLSQTHDIWHIVTGFDVSEMGEIGLQAFHLPQFPYPLAVTLLSSSLMATLLFQSYELTQLLEAIRQGWEMGHGAKPLFAQKWEEGWDKPLATWREELNIQPMPTAIAA